MEFDMEDLDERVVLHSSLLLIIRQIQMRANFDLLGVEEESEWEEQNNNQVRHKINGVTYVLPPNGTQSGGSAGNGDVKPDFLRQMSNTISRTKGVQSFRRSRLIHIFYIVALPAYTVFGAIIFKALDGAYDDQALIDYDNRCLEQRGAAVNLTSLCPSSPSPDACAALLRSAVMELDACFRNRSYTQFPTHSMSNFANALIFATSIYTTIGYGNIAPDTFGCRLAVCFYAVIGIPLFFAFLKDMGQLFGQLFIRGWRLAGRLRHAIAKRRRRKKNLTVRNLVESSVLPAHISIPMHKISNTLTGANKVREQRKVFLWAVGFFIIYLVACSYIFMWMEPTWDLWTAFYFLFTSVAMVGFGDVFPTEPSVVLINFAFIVLGIVLFGMCYFILQEEIREKAFQVPLAGVSRSSETLHSGPSRIVDKVDVDRRSSAPSPVPKRSPRVSEWSTVV